MYKVAQVTSESMQEAESILKRIYDEAPQHWPYGLKAASFDSGLYIIRDRNSNTPVGFCGFQERLEKNASRKLVKVGYYSIGILPEYRGNGFAKEAVSKLIAIKSARVDQVKALIMESNKPSQALADSLGVEKIIKKAFFAPQKSTAERTAEGAGAVASGMGAGAIMSTGIGKATPSFIDLGHKLFTGPSSEALFDALEATHGADAVRLKSMAFKHPKLFKMMLAGMKLPGISMEAQQQARKFAFNIRPQGSQLGDVLVSGPMSEITGKGRLLKALSGGSLHHTSIGLPAHMDSWAFLAGRGQGVQNWKGNLSDMPDASVVLRSRNPLNVDKVTEGVNTAFSKPYSYGLRNRLAAKELLGTPWSRPDGNSLTEKILNKVTNNSVLKKTVSYLPGGNDILRDVRMFSNPRLAQRMCVGNTCSTAAAEALQHADKSLFKGIPSSAVTPSDFLRGVGRDFDVVAMNLPSKLQGKGQLLLDHVMKAAPHASRLAIAAPFLAGAGYLGHRALQDRNR